MFVGHEVRVGTMPGIPGRVGVRLANGTSVGVMVGVGVVVALGVGPVGDGVIVRVADTVGVV